jgi:hypothetical protein
LQIPNETARNAGCFGSIVIVWKECAAKTKKAFRVFPRRSLRFSGLPELIIADSLEKLEAAPGFEPGMKDLQS